MKRTLENLKTLLEEMMRLERIEEDHWREQGRSDLAEAHKRIRWAYDDVVSLISKDREFFDKMWQICIEKRIEDESR